MKKSITVLIALMSMVACHSKMATVTKNSNSKVTNVSTAPMTLCVEGHTYNAPTGFFYKYNFLYVVGTNTGTNCAPPQPPTISTNINTSLVMCLNGKRYKLTQGFQYFFEFLNIPSATALSGTCSADTIFANGLGD